MTDQILKTKEFIEFNMTGFFANLSDHPELCQGLEKIYKTHFSEAPAQGASLFSFMCDVIFFKENGTDAYSLYKRNDEQEKLAKMYTHLKEAHRIFRDLHPGARVRFCEAANENLSKAYTSWEIDVEKLQEAWPFGTRFGQVWDMFFATILGKQNYRSRGQYIKSLNNVALEPTYDKSPIQSENRFLKAKIMELCINVWNQNTGKIAPIALNDTNSPFENFLRDTLICAGLSENINLKDVAQAYAEYHPKSDLE